MTATVLDLPPPPSDDRVVVVPGDWSTFEALLRARGASASPRFAFSQGAIEIMITGRRHERTKSRLGSLVEVYMLETRTRFNFWGSTTLLRPEEAGAEPDESYAFSAREDRPDLVLEVVYTSGGLNKLDVYKALEVPEVWFWTERGGIRVFVLESAGYVESPSSRFLPDIDFPLLSKHLGMEGDDSDALLSYRGALAQA